MGRFAPVVTDDRSRPGCSSGDHVFFGWRIGVTFHAGRSPSRPGKGALDGRGKLDQLERLLDHHFLSKRIIGPRQIVVSGHEKNCAPWIGRPDAGRQLRGHS